MTMTMKINKENKKKSMNERVDSSVYHNLFAELRILEISSSEYYQSITFLQY